MGLCRAPLASRDWSWPTNEPIFALLPDFDREKTRNDRNFEPSTLDWDLGSRPRGCGAAAIGVFVKARKHKLKMDKYGLTVADLLE